MVFCCRNNYTIAAQGAEAADLIIRIDVYEQHTLLAARRSLSELLSGFQLPGIAPADDKIFGAAAFTSPDEHVMVFAVGTLVFMLRNVGKDLTPVGEVVKFINQSLLDYQPAATNQAVNPMNRFHFESGEARVNDEVRLKEAPTDALERRRFYKFLSDKGETFLKEGSLACSPAESANTAPYKTRRLHPYAGGAFACSDVCLRGVHVEIKEGHK